LKYDRADVVPEFVVQMDGIELHDMDANAPIISDVPRTMHAPDGFVLLPSGYATDDDVLKPVQLLELVNHSAGSK
ncbi:MAG: hypothetical protein ACRD3W_28955, partial [Terriglobales bacterium]